jgi:dTDP-4-amino-4,6-dideoxygalactose transaminase
MKKTFFFNIPEVVGNEFVNLSKLSKLKQYSANGYFTKRCEDWLKKNIKCKEAFLVHSCTAALEISALLLNIKNGDEIIMPSYTFVSTANAFALRGGKPVFVDIDPKTCNIDPAKIEQSISKKTRAIVVVHYAGISCDMDSILRIAKKHSLYLIEDAAQAIMSGYKDKSLGSFGDLATLSFHETKNIHCGEGGALLINNRKFIQRAKIIRDKGTNRDLFNKNVVKKYSWVGLGSSYGLSEVNAAFLYAQFQKAKKITRYKKKIFNLYIKKLKILEIKGLIKLPIIPSYSNYNGHIFYIHILQQKRSGLINYLKKKSTTCLFHYIPLHNSPFGKKKGITRYKMSNTNSVTSSLLRLPMYYGIKKKDVITICSNISNFYSINI